MARSFSFWRVIYRLSIFARVRTWDFSDYIFHFWRLRKFNILFPVVHSLAFSRLSQNDHGSVVYLKNTNQFQLWTPYLTSNSHCIMWIQYNESLSTLCFVFDTHLTQFWLPIKFLKAQIIQKFSCACLLLHCRCLTLCVPLATTFCSTLRCATKNVETDPSTGGTPTASSDHRCHVPTSSTPAVLATGRRAPTIAMPAGTTTTSTPAVIATGRRAPTIAMQAGTRSTWA